MKKILLSILVLLSIISQAQTSGNPKVDEMIAKMKKQNNAKGTMHIVALGTVADDSASILKTTDNNYLVGSNFSMSNANTKLYLYVSKIANGKQALLVGKKSNAIAIINGKVYEIIGDIVFTIKGSTASAICNGTLYEVDKKKGKASTTTSGTIQVNFKNLLVP